jgi:hypothetical protein
MFTKFYEAKGTSPAMEQDLFLIANFIETYPRAIWIIYQNLERETVAPDDDLKYVIKKALWESRRVKGRFLTMRLIDEPGLYRKFQDENFSRINLWLILKNLDLLWENYKDNAGTTKNIEDPAAVLIDEVLGIFYTILNTICTCTGRPSDITHQALALISQNI